MSAKPPTSEELLGRARNIAAFGPGPQGPVTQVEAPASPATASGLPLSDDDVLSLKYQSEPYTLANGREVFVHPCSIEEARWLNIRAAQEVRTLGLTHEADATLAFQMHAKCWQVVCCLRVGPEIGAAATLQPKHAEILRRNAGWLNDVDRIVVISDKLTGGVSESERLKEQLRGFFETAASCCETLLSQLDTATPAELRPSLEAFAGSVSQARSLLN